MRLTIVNKIIINIDLIEYCEPINNDQSILIHFNSGTSLLFDVADAQNLMYWLNELILKGCRGGA